MAIGSDIMRLLVLDAEEGAGDPAPLTDTGLDSLSSIDLLGFGMCLFLSLFAMKFKSFPGIVVSSIGWMIVGFQVASNADSPVIFILTLAIAGFQMAYGSKWKGW